MQPAEDDRARILVVEDDVSIRVLLTHLLQEAYDVAVVSTFDAALQAAAEHPADLLVLDINLRDGQARTGFDLLRAIRAIPGYEATPALACTAYATRYNQDRFLERGFDGCVPKPLTYSSVRRAVGAVLGGGTVRLPGPAPRIEGRRGLAA